MKEYGAHKATEFTKKQINIIFAKAKNHELRKELKMAILTYGAKLEPYTRIKDIYMDITLIADETGYSPDFLVEAFEENRDEMEAGFVTPHEIMESIRDISMEKDW